MGTLVISHQNTRQFVFSVEIPRYRIGKTPKQLRTYAELCAHTHITKL